MNRKRTGYLVSILFLLIVFFCSTGGTLAALAAQGTTVNKITVGTVSGQVLEEYDQGQTVMPGDTVSKVATVKNTGDLDMLVRVKITKAWGQTRNADGTLIIDPSLDTENIQIVYDEENWYYDSSDGYYYYIGVLKPGDITPPLLKEFTVDENSGNEYQGMHADVVLHTECIQAGGNAVSAWGKTLEDLGITYRQEAASNTVTGVRFLNPEKGFSFDASAGDLFANFKALIPGESRSQDIYIANSYSVESEIFLRAEAIDQNQATDQTRELIDKLLKQYATITITDDNGAVIYNGPVWGNPNLDSHGTDSMKYNISLGSYASGKTRKLHVNLFLDPSIGNEYQEILGLIKWSFEANGKETKYPLPNTGDNIHLPVFVFVMLLSGIGICILIVRYFKLYRKTSQN